MGIARDIASKKAFGLRETHPLGAFFGGWWVYNSGSSGKQVCGRCSAEIKYLDVYVQSSRKGNACEACALSELNQPAVAKNIDDSNKASTPKACICDFDTVIMATGCVCGGI